MANTKLSRVLVIITFVLAVKDFFFQMDVYERSLAWPVWACSSSTRHAVVLCGVWVSNPWCVFPCSQTPLLIAPGDTQWNQ